MSETVHRYHVFETANGPAAIAWTATGVSAFRLPAGSPDVAERSLLRRLPMAARGAPPARVAAIVAAARRYFEGERTDFAEVPVDLGEQEPLFTRIYAAVRRLGWGETTSYGAVATALGAGPEVARDVGRALAMNPVPLIIPCPRVLAAGGKVGGFSAPGGSAAKQRMLELEGVHVAPVQQQQS